jgi:hypothetical protein
MNARGSAASLRRTTPGAHPTPQGLVTAVTA